MNTLQNNINNLMAVRAKVFASHGMYWANSATTNFERGTFGVGQLIAEAVEMSESSGVPQYHHVAGFFYDSAAEIVKYSKPSKVRDNLREFSAKNEISGDAMDLIVMDLCDAELVAAYSYSMDSLRGVDSIGRTVKQK